MGDNGASDTDQVFRLPGTMFFSPEPLPTAPPSPRSVSLQWPLVVMKDLSRFNDSRGEDADNQQQLPDSSVHHSITGYSCLLRISTLLKRKKKQKKTRRSQTREDGQCNSSPSEWKHLQLYKSVTTEIPLGGNCPTTCCNDDSLFLSITTAQTRQASTEEA